MNHVPYHPNQSLTHCKKWHGCKSMGHDQTFHKTRKTMLTCNKASSLYYGKLGHIHIECLKKHGQHITCVTSFINPCLERLGNEDDLS